MIPQKVRDVIRKVPHLGKNAVAKREGLCFVSVYLLHRAVDLYDQAMSLDMDYKMYRQEFAWLQMELQPVIDLIQNELLPQWEYHSTAALRKITTKVIDKLSRYNAEFKQLVRVIHNDIKKSLSHRRWAAVYTLGSTALYVASVFVGNIPGAILGSAAGFTGLVTCGSLSVTIQKLGSLQNDVEMICNETEEYRSLLEQKLLHGMLLESLNYFILFSLIILYLWFQPNEDRYKQERREHEWYRQDEDDYKLIHGEIGGEHDSNGQERDEYGETRDKNELDGQEWDENKHDGKMRDEDDLDGQERDKNKQHGKPGRTAKTTIIDFLRTVFMFTCPLSFTSGFFLCANNNNNNNVYLHCKVCAFGGKGDFPS